MTIRNRGTVGSSAAHATIRPRRFPRRSPGARRQALVVVGSGHRTIEAAEVLRRLPHDDECRRTSWSRSASASSRREPSSPWKFARRHGDFALAAIVHRRPARPVRSRRRGQDRAAGLRRAIEPTPECSSATR
ncbi:hypothetical protein HBB16_12465 [Pseudonocardia sp. MCCB 268]|nr:hypothetical protein [Pseudonocardia cytotoxica]